MTVQEWAIDFVRWFACATSLKVFTILSMFLLLGQKLYVEKIFPCRKIKSVCNQKKIKNS